MNAGAFEGAGIPPDRLSNRLTASWIEVVDLELLQHPRSTAAVDVGGPLLAWGRLDGVPGEADVPRGQVGAVVGDDAGRMAAPAGSADQVVI